MEKVILESKVWYRFLKVVYFFSFSVIVLIVTFFLWVSFPQFYSHWDYEKLQKARQVFPEYSSLAPQELVDTIYTKFYSHDFSRNDFYKKIGFEPKPNLTERIIPILKHLFWSIFLFIALSSILDTVKSAIMYVIRNDKFSYPILTKSYLLIKNIKLPLIFHQRKKATSTTLENIMPEYAST